MKILYVGLGIYGFGVMLTVILVGIFMYANLLADKFSLTNLLKFPLYLIFGFLCGLIWPLMIVKDESFREILIDCGTVAIPLGYLGSVLFTPIYPWVWAWYISGVVAWKLLKHYHERVSLETKNILVQSRE
ncbi:MAG: hypothetical protein HYT64_00435 [Candidatus Yanofskybacteria bacterium]|nr:hypothetical protein [Candidatus Yanofskybacteria bacterium]